MKPPVDNVKVSSKGRDILIQAKRQTGLKQWNELLRWAFCISISTPESPKINWRLDSGIEPIEWTTFAGAHGNLYTALFLLRAKREGIDLEKAADLQLHFRLHIERGILFLRQFRQLESLISHSIDQSASLNSFRS